MAKYFPFPFTHFVFLLSIICYWCIIFNRESPVVKGNCLLALTGLAVAVAKHEKGLSSDTEEQFDVS